MTCASPDKEMASCGEKVKNIMMLFYIVQILLSYSITLASTIVMHRVKICRTVMTEQSAASAYLRIARILIHYTDPNANEYIFGLPFQPANDSPECSWL